MLSKKEIKKWLLKNCIDKDGNLDLSNLDFSDFDGNVNISHMKVKSNLYQGFQEVEKDLFQRFQEVNGNLYQECQKVKGDLFQNGQKFDLCKILGVKEREKFKLKGHSCYYYIEENKIWSSCDGCDLVGKDNISVNDLFNLEILPYKKTYFITQDTFHFLKTINENLFLTMDKNKDIYLFENKPTKSSNCWYSDKGCLYRYYKKRFYKNVDLSFIKWEDDEPTLIKDILENCEIIEREEDENV